MIKNIGLISLVIIIGGCATVTPKLERRAIKGDFIELTQFCKENKLKYSYDTIDDVVRIKSKEKDIRVLLNSPVVYFNGYTFYVKNSPFYEKGLIYLPRELEEIISRKPSLTQVRTISINTVVVDPGHGGKDPGAISRRGTKEKDINLKVAKLLKKELEKRGIEVHLTRSQDVFLTLRRRVQIAKERNADLFISIHSNSNRNREVNGVEVYYLSPRYFDDDKKVAKLAKETPSGLKHDYSANTKFIIWDLICVENNAVSIEFAVCLVDIFKRLGFKTKPPKGAPFYVLKYGYVPSVLVEIGYLSNYYEEKLLRSWRYQKQLAEAIALGVASLNERYVKLAKEYERRK